MCNVLFLVNHVMSSSSVRTPSLPKVSEVSPTAEPEPRHSELPKHEQNSNITVLTVATTVGLKINASKVKVMRTKARN